MNIVASVILYRHSFEDVYKTIDSLIEEDIISKIVLVDNGGFCAWTGTLSHPKIEVIVSEKNIGFGAGNNIVFQKYKNATQFFLLCNPDVTFKKGEVNKLYQSAIKNQLGLVVPKILYADGRLQYNCRLLPTPAHLFLRRFFPSISKKHDLIHELHQADYNQLFEAPFYSGCFMLINSEAIHRVGCFDSRFFLYMEDVDFSRRISSQVKTSYYPDAVIIHDFKKGSYKNVKLLKFHMISAFHYFNKWGWLFDRERAKINKECLNILPTMK